MLLDNFSARAIVELRPSRCSYVLNELAPNFSLADIILSINCCRSDSAFGFLPASMALL